MHGNYSATTIIMPEEMVALLDADNIKPIHPEDLDEIFAFELR
jgi:hypothetical protein